MQVRDDALTLADVAGAADPASGMPYPTSPSPEMTAPGPLAELLGLNGRERYQTWPERLVRSAVSAPADALQGRIPSLPGLHRQDFTDIPGQGQPSDPMVERAMDTANLAMAGGMPMAAKGALGSAGGALKAAAPEAPRFYSAVEHAVNTAKQEAGSPEQWMGMIRNTPGVKQEEIDWLGLEDWMKAQKHPVTREEIQNYLDGHKIEVHDALNTNVGGGGGLELGGERAGDFLGRWLDDEDSMIHPDKNDMPVYPHIMQEGNHYQLFEGDYELGVFGTKAAAENDLANFKSALKNKDEDALLEYAGLAAGHNNMPGEVGKYSEYQLPGGTNYNELLLTLPEKAASVIPTNRDLIQKYGSLENAFKNWTPKEEHQWEAAQAKARTAPNDYQSPHWDEPNVLAHVRFNDRTIDGKKTLFLEEVQSDWHQQGRKAGYRDEQYQIPNFDDAVSRGLVTAEKFPDGKWRAQIPGRADTALPLARTKEEAIEAARQFYRQDSAVKREGVVPDAPFKKTWPVLVLKRMIRHAAENGYDKIAWTPGEVQAKRWSGTGEEGHGKFYDEILPHEASKLGKPFGAKVEKNSGLVDNIEKPNDKTAFIQRNFLIGSKGHVHSMDITLAMRDAAMRKGFPLFSGGAMLVPIDHDPFEKDKQDSHEKLNDFIKKLIEEKENAKIKTIQPPPGDEKILRPIPRIQPEYRR